MATRSVSSGLAATAALLMGFATYTTAQISQQCPSSDICYSLSISEAAASSGSGDIYFQLSGPTSYSWIALGQGSSMSGANIFVMYTDSTGQNVTVSPRLGTGHVQPQHDTAAQIELLEGSGVANGVMTANVRCSNCDSWSGGSMDFSSSSGSWIYAWTSGSALDSDQLDANINQHEQASSFNWDFSAAKSSTTGNPFVASSGSGTSTDSGSVPASCTPIANQAGATASATADSNGASSTSTSTSSSSDDDGDDSAGRPPWPYNNSGHNDNDGRPPWWNDDNDNDDSNNQLRRRQSSSCPAGYAPIGASNNDFAGPSGSRGPASNTVLLAHAVLASLAFVALFPIGGILIRVASFRGLVWVHAGLQGLAYVLYIAAFGLGVWMASNMRYLSRAHPIIGIVLFVILLGQPVFGYLHHRLFKKYAHRTLWSYVHISIGRVAILLGIVNGGLGLQLAGSQGSSVIAYAVVAAVMALAYLAAIVFGEVKRRRARSAAPAPMVGKGESPPRYSNSEEMEYFGPGRSS